jgi:tetratricopeptide (TPR) repeat protein
LNSIDVKHRICRHVGQDDMKKTLLIIVCVFSLAAGVSFNRGEPLANENRSGLYVRSIEQVLRLDEKEVDLATAALIISEQWSDLVNGRRYLSELDDMALEIRSRLKAGGLRADYKAIAVINEYLFDELGFESVPQADEPDDLFLYSVLDKKRGYCLSLSILYLSLAERLGLPLYGVVVPGHFFVRYDDGQVRFNIETTSKGGYAPDEHYISKFKVQQDNQDSIYMKNLSKIQTLGCFFNNLGNSYNDIGNTASALTALERAVEINPLLAESRTNLGNVYLKAGRIEDAIYQYRAALEINPNDSKTHNNLGNAYTKKDWLNDAISQYNLSLKLDPNFADAYRSLANTYSKQQMFAQAQWALKQAIILEPKNTDSYCRLGDIYIQMSDFEQAISEYEKALKIKPDLAEAHYGLGVCYSKLGPVCKEIQAYKRALAIQPEMVAAAISLGNAYFGQKQYDDAIQQYQKAVHIKPIDAVIYYNLGAAYSNKDDYQRAASQYLKAVEIDPQMSDAHSGLAFAFYRLKKYHLAWEHIKIARQLGAEIDENLLAAIEDNL